MIDRIVQLAQSESLQWLVVVHRRHESGRWKNTELKPITQASAYRLLRLCWSADGVALVAPMRDQSGTSATLYRYAPEKR